MFNNHQYYKKKTNVFDWTSEREREKEGKKKKIYDEY